MSATTSGADTGGSARSREHNQGNQGRAYTVEQKAAVLRIRKCSPTAFYDILGLETVKTSCSESEIKKAYRKLSLLTHPDKNGYEHADEAFKMVSRAFGVLGDKEKREKFDKYGTDPDSRFESARAQHPFSGFASRQQQGARAGGFEEELTPEEMFARFFGGGFGGGPFGGEYNEHELKPVLTEKVSTQVHSLSLTLAEVQEFEFIRWAEQDREEGLARLMMVKKVEVSKHFLDFFLLSSSSFSR